MWRGEIFPANTAESDNIRNQLDTRPHRGGAAPSLGTDGHRQGGQRAPFLELDASEQNQKFRARLKDFCQKAYKKTHVTKMEERTATTCQRENPFYIDTVRAFRDRRYEYKALNKTWGKKKAEKADDIGSRWRRSRCARCTTRSR